MADRYEQFDRDLRVAAQARAAEHYRTARVHQEANAAGWFVEREQRSGAFWSACARRLMGIDDAVN
jgi:hypothetical protein